MRKLLVVLVATFAVAAIVPTVASANTITVGVCDLTAKTPWYTGINGVFEGDTDNCGTLGTGAAHYLEVCAQYNSNGTWLNYICTGQRYANAIGQDMKWQAQANCHIWFRDWAWADVDHEGNWVTGTVTSNASYRC